MITRTKNAVDSLCRYSEKIATNERLGPTRQADFELHRVGSCIQDSLVMNLSHYRKKLIWLAVSEIFLDGQTGTVWKYSKFFRLTHNGNP